MEPGENIAARRHTWPEARVSPTEDAGCYRPWPPQKVTVIGEEHSARPDEIRDLLTIPSKLRADSGHVAIDDCNGRTAQLVRAPPALPELAYLARRASHRRGLQGDW